MEGNIVLSWEQFVELEAKPLPVWLWPPDTFQTKTNQPTSQSRNKTRIWFDAVRGADLFQVFSGQTEATQKQPDEPDSVQELW